MPITINWTQKIINVPKDYLILIQAVPTEIREMDLNQFRLDLRDLEDGEDGIMYLRTHDHNTEVTVGGVTLARVVEIINGYSVTFEDGQYAVNLVGANSNVADVANVNQVSIRSGNSAGLVTSAGIEALEYRGGVTIDVINGESGSVYPIGTLRRPVNNFDDAKIIAAARGFNTFYVKGNATCIGHNLNGLIIIGENPVLTLFTINGCTTEGTEFEDMSITGAFNGTIIVKNCELKDITGFLGTATNCILSTTLGLAGSFGDNVLFLDCWLGSYTVGGVTTIDMNGDGPSLNMRGHAGAVKIINKSGASKVAIDLLSGRIILDSTVTGGTFYLRGVGEISEDNSSGTTIFSIMVSPNTIADQVLDEMMAEHVLAGSVAEAIREGGTGATRVPYISDA